MGKIVAAVVAFVVVVGGVWWLVASRDKAPKMDDPGVGQAPQESTQMMASKAQASTDPTMVKPFTMAQVSERSGKSSCWVVVRDTVYNVTGLLEDGADTGGMQGIESWCGKDATEEFSKYAGKEDAERVLGNNQIGLLSK